MLIGIEARDIRLSVVCVLPHFEADPGIATHLHHDRAGTSPTRHPISAHQNTRMQATVRMALVNQFKDRLQEGNAVTLHRYSLGEIQPKLRIVSNPLRLSFLSNTGCENCTDLPDQSMDVTGRVVACDDLDNYDKIGRAEKKKPLTLIDSEGTELRCTLWGVYAQQFSEFLNNCSDHGKIIVVLQLFIFVSSYTEKCASKMDFMEQNCFCLTGTQQSMPMNFLKLRLLGKGAAESEHNTSRISTASKNSTKDDFVTKFPLKNIAELLDVEQGVPSIIGGSICAIQEEEGWWYLGCRSCRKKVVKSSDIVDLESDTKPNPSAGANERWCSKCKATVTSIKTQFHMQVRVQDETGTVSVSLFNDEVQAILNNIIAYQLVEKYGKGDGAFSAYIMEMVDKKFVLKVSIDGKNKEKVMPVFNVLRLSNDPDIIKSVCAAAIPGKPENEATSSKVVDVAPFNGNVNGEQSPTGTTSQEKRKVDGVDKPVLAYHEENSSTKKTKFVLDKEIKVEKPLLGLSSMCQKGKADATEKPAVDQRRRK
ncbi:nucleic acid-binding, OB-fold protein [Artemisia annua]|uniref:Nucleic acid-binding, OB-fold protein n=1 Tax=Artemisia annua TaxID=35608 RepID=A0A2U1LGL5_ARTAN|nr:nucleic acid-binding, OB-fold protein [Artemisia annua]